MANLKVDLVNKLNNDKFYAEIELVRLAQEPNMNYKQKIELMEVELTTIALTNGMLGLVEQYFQEPAQPAPAPAQPATPSQQPTGQVHAGQSHGE